ncbi:MAG: hypothetical protein ACRCZF_17650, partial [Gemmataceae bacterium]
MTKAGIVIEVPEPMIEGEMEPKKPVPEVPPVKPAAVPVAERDLAAKKVVKAIAVIAEVNGVGDKLRGDALTELYLRTAADVASHEDPKIQAAAFNLGIGIALDDSDMLRSNRLTADLCRRIESDAERAQRLKFLGTPTLQKRRDWCQHFVVSCALTEIVGAALAEQAGLAKELSDMKKPSGFSFSDLGADLAGVQLAKFLAKKPKHLEEWTKRFPLEEIVPKLDDLPDALPEAKFNAKYGSIADERFQEQLEAIRKRVTSQKLYDTPAK